MMKRLVKMFFFLALLVLVAGLVVPSFIDWNQHKDKIMAQLSPYFERRIEVAGNISLQIIPQPEVMLEQVTVANADGAKSGPLLTLKQLGIRIKLEPLLEGRIEVESLDMVSPVLNLEVLESGKTGWTGVMKETSSGALGSAAAAVQLNRVSIVNGTLNYTNPATGTQLKIENLNLAVIADTLLGPYNIVGNMKYRNLPVNMEIVTKKYDMATPFPLRVSFMPASGLPQVRFNGVMDLQSGVDMQGEIAVEQGNLASLFDMKALDALRFMNDPVDLRAVMELKADQFLLSDMKAKFGQKGDLKGKLSMQSSRGGKPVLHLDVEGSNLVVSEKREDAYLEVPEAFTGNIRARGKNIVWAGQKIPAADINVDFNGKEWRAKSVAIDLPGSSQVKLVGTASPGAGSGSYTLQLVTADLGKLVAALSPAENSVFKYFSDTGLVRKFTLSSNLEVSAARLSFFNMNAVVGEKTKLTGVVNIDRVAQRPNFVAKVNAVDWDVAAFPAEAYSNFWQKVMQSDADIELTAQNVTKESLSIRELSLKGTVSEQGVNFEYHVKTDGVGDGAAAVPPLLRAWNNVDLKGEIRGRTPDYSFSAAGQAEGGEAVLSGDIGRDSFRVNVSLRHPDAARGLALLEFPVLRLAGDGALNFSGEMQGGADHYRIDKIQAHIGTSGIFGSIEKTDAKYTADLKMQQVNLDKWLAGDWGIKRDVSLTLEGDELVWQGLHILSPQLTAEAGSSSVKIPALTGKLFNGQLSADLELTRQGQVWSSSFKGSLKQADLGALKTRLGLGGFSPGTGDIDFSLASADNTPANAAGYLEVKATTLKVDNFNFDKLGDTVDHLTTVPTLLQGLVSGSLYKSGGTAFSDVTGRFKVEKGRIGIESLKLETGSGAMDVSGSVNIKGGTYAVSGNLQLNQPPGVPVLAVQCASESPECTVDSEPLRKFIIKNNPAPVVVQPDVVEVPPPAAALPPVQREPEKNAVSDILKRLDEEDGTAGVSPKP